MAVIDPFRKVRFSADLAHQAQQQVSILSGTVDREELSGDKIFLDDYGTISMQKVVGRSPDTPTGTVPRNRRMMFREEFIFAELLHRNDRLDFDGMVEPNSKYRKTFDMSVQREIDQSIIDAFDADSRSGETGSTTVAFTDTGEGIQIDGTVLTNVIVQQAAQQLDDNNIPSEDRFMVMEPFSWRVLLTQALAGPHIASIDYNDQKPSVNHGGDTLSWGGFTIMKSTLLPISATTNSKRYVFFWQKMGMVLGIANEGRWEVDVRADKSHSTQTAMYLDIGATRRLPGFVGRISLSVQ